MRERKARLNGTRKMFYFSFDNKEEMFIRLRGGWDAEIHYTINIY